MKKFISILLCAAILVSSLGILAAAQKKDETPVIFVPGFLQPYMYIEGENGAEDEYLWLPKKEKIFDRIIDDMPNFLLSIFGLLLGDVETPDGTPEGKTEFVTGMLSEKQIAEAIGALPGKVESVLRLLI